MRIVTTGMSRIVFVFKDVAVKFPWINFIVVLRSYFKHKKNGVAKAKLTRFHKNKMVAAVILLGYIFCSNRREYLYWKRHPDDNFIHPVLKSYLYGFIIVQQRAAVCNASQPQWKKFVSNIQKIGVDNIGLLQPENFGILQGELKLLDYGSDLTQNVLQSAPFKTLYG